MTPLHFCRYDIGQGEPLRHKGDCTVRALAVAANMPYRNAWQLLYQLQAKHMHCFFEIFDYLRQEPETFGVIQYLAYPARRGAPRTTVLDFAIGHARGHYIVQVARHATAVVNGVILDTWNCGHKCIYGAWEIGRRP